MSDASRRRHRMVGTGRWLLVVLLVVAAACAEPGAADHPGGQFTTDIALDGWRIDVAVEPVTVGPIGVSVGEFAAGPPKEGSAAWMHHSVIFENEADEAARFDHSETAAFMRHEGDPVLLVADSACGFADRGGKLVELVCDLARHPFSVSSQEKISRTIRIYKDLDGMSELREGTYVFHKDIRFTIQGETFAETLRLSYRIRADA